MAKKFRKYWGVFAQNTKTGEIQGYVEHSFQMGWSKTHVRAWPDLKNAEYYFKLQQTQYKSGGYRYFLLRISRRNSTILVNLSKGKDKFSSRNKQFFVFSQTEKKFRA